MKLMTGAVLAAVMLAAAPAWADRGGDHGRGHGYGHGRWQEVRHYHPYYAPPRVVYREVVRYPAYYAPPVVYAPQPAAGIHVVLPNIFIPIR